MHSISILAFSGSAATWYVERAGAGAGKSATRTANIFRKKEKERLRI